MKESFYKNLTVRTNQKIYMILLLVSIILFFFNIWKIKPVVINVNDFLGLVSHLTIFYWVGLVLITICSILIYLDDGLNNDYIFISCLVIVGLFLFGIGVFSQENTRDSISYYPVGEVKNILTDQHIDYTASYADYPLISYRSWPGIHLISANILYLANIEFSDIIKYMPIFWFISIAFVTFTMGNRLRFTKNQSFLVAFFLLSSYWLIQSNYTPQALGYIIYIIIFMGLMISINDNTTNTGNKAANKIVTLLAFCAIVITHFLTSVSLIFSMFFSYRKKILILFVMIFISWHIYLATAVVKIGIRQFIDQAATADFFHITTGRTYEIVSPFRQLVRASQVSYFIIYGIGIMSSTLLYMFKKVKEENRENIKFCILWLLAVLMLTVVKYGTEVSQRAYILSLPPAICLVIWSTPNIKKIFIVILVMFAAFHIPAAYGGTSYGSQTLTTELKGSEFFASKMVPYDYNSSFIYEHPAFQYYVKYYSPYAVIMTSNSIFYGNENESKSEKADKLYDISKYILYSKQSHSSLLYEINSDPVNTLINKNAGNLSLTYNNGNFDIYRKR